MRPVGPSEGPDAAATLPGRGVLPARSGTSGRCSGTTHRLIRTAHRRSGADRGRSCAPHRRGSAGGPLPGRLSRLRQISPLATAGRRLPPLLGPPSLGDRRAAGDRRPDRPLLGGAVPGADPRPDPCPQIHRDGHLGGPSRRRPGSPARPRPSAGRPGDLRPAAPLAPVPSRVQSGGGDRQGHGTAAWPPLRSTAGAPSDRPAAGRTRKAGSAVGAPELLSPAAPRKVAGPAAHPAGGRRDHDRGDDGGLCAGASRGGSRGGLWLRGGADPGEAPRHAGPGRRKGYRLSLRRKRFRSICAR